MVIFAGFFSLIKAFFVKTKVVYMCSSLLQLASGSRDLSQAEKRITGIYKAEQIKKK